MGMKSNVVGRQLVRKRGKKEYLYYAYYDDGRRIEVYCGSVGDAKADRKAAECEIRELTKHKKAIAGRLTVLNRVIKRNQ